MNAPNLLNSRWLLMVGMLLAFTMLAPSAYLQQQGDSGGKEGKESPASTGQNLKQSVFAGGGGTSAGGSIRIEASIGQPVVDFSTNPPLALNSGFWPGAIPCPFSLDRTAQMFGARGGQGALKITATGACGWTAAADATWIAFVTQTAGTGNGELSFEVRENFTGSAREGAITIGDYTYSLVQDAGLGPDCDFLLIPAFQSFPASGGSASIQVVADSRCAWEVGPSESFLTINSNKVGIGNKTVTYSVAANPGPSGRNATITIGGKVFEVKQK